MSESNLLPALTLYIVFSLGYLFFHLYLHAGLRKYRRIYNTAPLKKVSVIIAARDEEENITYCLGSLLKQTYPRDHFEVIVVDDHSQDRTRSIVQQCAAKFSNIRLTSSPPLLPHTSPKKTAIATGINLADGEILLFTDADCAVPPEWIERMVRCYDEHIGAVASWVLPVEEKRLITQIEALDVLAYQLIGAGAIGMGRPFLANGANFSYRKQLFIQIEGFKNIQELGSGDDDLFLQKLYQNNDQQTLFLQDPHALVITLPVNSWRDFFRQRVRWSSKFAAYDRPVRWLAVSIYGYYLLLIAAIPLALSSFIPLWLAVMALAIKFYTDWALLRAGAKKLNRRFPVFIFFLAELVHLSYIPCIGILGVLGRYSWKNRLFKRGILFRH